MSAQPLPIGAFGMGLDDIKVKKYARICFAWLKKQKLPS